jgi:outer membrane protein
MNMRSGLSFGLSLLLAASPALAQGSAAANHARPHGRPAKPVATPVRRASPGTAPHTLAEALAVTYSYQPLLLAARAQLRSTDENVPQALAGWRPTVVVAGSTGYGDGTSRLFQGGQFSNTRTDRLIATAQTTLTQPIYTGGRVNSSVHRAENLVFAQRANLLASEESSFADVVNAYVGVIQARQTLAIQQNNVQVLGQQLRATQDRFRVGEITQTDVAQAEAALAGAESTAQTAQGNVLTAEATYLRTVGYQAPPDLVPPQPLGLPVRTQEQAIQMAQTNNPAVIAAEFNAAAAKNAVDQAFAALLPQLSVQGQIFQSNNSTLRSSQSNGYQVLANLSVPLYQGGSEYSAVRQARETVQQQTELVGDAQRTAVQNAVQAWETLTAARAASDSSRVAIRANEVAVEGVERQALVGTATTLDVLIQQQNLLNARLTLVQNLANLVTASYGVASAVGRLTARDLNLPVPLYDDTAYYRAVRNKWFGVGIPPETRYFGR